MNPRLVILFVLVMAFFVISVFGTYAQAAGNYAIYVSETNTDGVIFPVWENLEARYLAAGKDFTIEYWFKLPGGYDSNGKELFDHHMPSNEGFWTAFQNGHLWGGIDAVAGNVNPEAIHIQTGSGFNDGLWHHYALVRNTTSEPDKLCLYLDGKGSCYDSGQNPLWTSVGAELRPLQNRNGDDTDNRPLYSIGGRTSGAAQISAAIDELRVSDLARYHGDFSPPTAPFTEDASTVMLFHFDEGAGNKVYGSNSMVGTLVKDFGYYGIGATPYTANDPYLTQMWVSGRFGSTCPRGDINGSCSVDGADLRLIIGGWLGNGSCASFNCDVMTEGKVNALDAAVVIGDFGK